ncbi:hypothetical protein Btru_042008 [Bulinus truncatus]|nr:hypothetical protein Btru_042008 [Bulinus truncatus]
MRLMRMPTEASRAQTTATSVNFTTMDPTAMRVRTEHSCEAATRMIVNEGRKVANCCTGPQRQELLRLCDEVDILTNRTFRLMQERTKAMAHKQKCCT